MEKKFNNQIDQTNFIKSKFSTYLRSTFDIRDKTYKKLYNDRLTELESKLYKGPYLSSTLPFEPSKSINELIKDNVFEKEFLKVGDLDFDRPCYAHQVNAFTRIGNGKNIVVTTGTGSGKTECFMLPIINELIKELNNGDKEPGVRAIFLFPLNALVYDQIDRLRSFLKNYEEIKFGFYTGRTPEDRKSKDGRKQIELYKRKYGEPSKNEILTREEMRANPPQILFTNYSMLEYLLIRPSDESLISQEALKHLKFIVLDEAHIYRGALGIEISFLLRRLLGTANKNVQFVLTSATLGRGKEDLPDIVDFASRLTSSKFTDDDIIFAIRHSNNITPKYKIEATDYKILLDSIENIEDFKNVYQKYNQYDDSVSVKVNLYNLLIKDENTQNLYHWTNRVGDFFDVFRNFYNFKIEDLTSLVELITKSQSNDSKYPLKLYDIKYHMFMKAPDGAFITLGNKKNLSLLTVNQIDGFKAFKIGICQNCKVPYIMGITENNYLCIDDEIDIDESYADKAKRLEYYLIGDCLTDEEKNDLDTDQNFEKYYLCAKCGYIKSAKSAITTSDCECFDIYRTVVYKFIGKDEQDLDDEDIVTNNIHRCPICEYKANNGGVIMGFHVGKDRATTLISQILYESMNYPVIKKAAQTNSLFKSKPKEVTGRKQFLAFSDSRQQAAFFSKFLNSNNDRFLKKTLIWELLKENNHEKISYLQLVTKLDDVFRNKLHYTEEEAIKHAKATALWELLLVDGRNSGEGIGLFAFKLNLNKGNYADEDALTEALQGAGFYNITGKQFKDITSQLFTLFRMAPAIEYETILCDDPEEKKELLGYRQRKMYIMEQDTKKTKDSDKPKYYPVKSFLPVDDGRTNNGLKYIMKTLGYDYNKAKSLMRTVFETAIEEEILIPNTEAPEYQNTYVIKANNYDLFSYKKLKFYKCQKCNKLTLYNVNNKCSEADCDGELIECDVDNDAFYKDNYYRNEYMNRPIEKLICREHTAQMNANEAKEIQDDFKSENGKINFISCSTTFEMGIDLGGLNTIFMRNVPPTPSNYAQRAGRAGRRAETSAFVLTFCGTSSHDYTYFSNPAEMIRGLVKPPYFVVDNDKIIMRHITATALSMYFKEPEFSEDFDSVEHFLSDDVANKFINYIKSKPAKLGIMVDKYVLKDSQLISKYGGFKWINYLDMSESSLNKMTEGLKGLVKLYKEAEEYARNQRDYSLANSYKESLRRLNTPNSLITYFTKYNVIPGYGFPVDNVELYIYDYDKEQMNEDYNLSRNLSVAISEYAPGSEVIVDERKYTSRYLFLPHNGYSLPATFYCECEKCHTINTSEDKNHFVSNNTCKYCGATLDTSMGKLKSYLTPIYGFVADKKNKESRRVKPFKTYASDVYYIGDNLSSNDELNNVVNVSEHKDEQLLVLNESRFYFCPHCGYTDLDKKNQLPTKTLEHREYRGKICQCGNKLELIHLGHSYRTDIIKISFNKVNEMFDEDTAISVLFALLEGISMTYNIERNDIGGMIYKTNIAKPYSFILFDTVAGGAGHVKRLKDDKSLMKVLQNALVKVSQNCCDEDTSCYNCLRTYNNQRLHKHIKRGLAKNALSVIITNIKNKNKNYALSDPQYDFTMVDINEFINSGTLDGSESNNTLVSLLNEISMKRAEIPDGYGYVLNPNDGSKVEYADFAWKDRNIILFTIENKKSYDNLANFQNKFDCYLLTDSFDYVEFVKKLLR